MDESLFHQEINNKLDKLVDLYKQENDLDDVVRSKIINIGTSNAFESGSGLLTTEDFSKTMPFENFLSPHKTLNTSYRASPVPSSFLSKEPLTIKELTLDQLYPSSPFNNYSYINPNSYPSDSKYHTSLSLSPAFANLGNQASPFISSSSVKDISTLQLFSPTKFNIDNTALSPISQNYEQAITIIKTPHNNISTQLSEQISFLLFELKKLKENNQKLSEELASCKHELSVTKNKLFVCETQSNPVTKQENLANLVEDVYRSQKVRDLAVVERLKTANEQRDSAILKANSLQQKILSGENKNDIVTALMRSYSVDDLKKTTDEFLRVIKEEKIKKKKMVEEEMEALIAEKDFVFKQKNQLEHENTILGQKMHDELKKRKVLLEKLKSTESERDECIEKLKDLYDELQKLKVAYNLHGSLSKEKQLHQKYNVLLDGAQDEVSLKQKQLRALSEDREQLIHKVKRLQEDNEILRRQNNQQQDKIKDESKEKEQLNRLVAVLRRKLAES